MAEGVDYSFDRPGVTELWAAGKQFAGRYFGLGTDNKLAHVGEIAALNAVGISVFAIAEQWGDSALQGFGLGLQHAIKVQDDMAAKGVPGDRPVYFAVDFDVQAYQWHLVYDYFSGVNSVLPLDRIGIYGGINTMEWAKRDGLARWFFQTYAWSAGRIFPDVHVLQYSNTHYIGGGKVDYCRSYKDDFGQWGGLLIPSVPVVSGPAPVVSGQSWDYVNDIDAAAGDDGQLGASIDGYARDLDGLRNL